MARLLSVHEAAMALRAGDVVAFPTETVYGLGARADSDEACLKIYSLKGRPSNNPLIIHVDSLEMLHECCALSPELSARVSKLAENFWPGPLTLILPASARVCGTARAGGDTIGVRIPNSPLALSLIAEVGLPLAAPSANRSSYTSPTSAAHVASDFSSADLGIIDGGPCHAGIESTILDLSGTSPSILRPGVVTAESLSETLQENVSVPRIKPTVSGDPLPSPGLLEKHYAPITPMRYLSSAEVTRVLSLKSGSGIGVILTTGAFDISAVPNAEIEQTSTDGAPLEIARNLYAAIRKLDGLDLDVLLVEEPLGTDDVSQALRERISRAVSKITKIT